MGVGKAVQERPILFGHRCASRCPAVDPAEPPQGSFCICPMIAEGFGIHPQPLWMELSDPPRDCCYARRQCLERLAKIVRHLPKRGWPELALAPSEFWVVRNGLQGVRESRFAEG